MKHIPAALLAALVFVPFAQGEPPTFSRDIAPIIYRNCAACHRPGEAGPFSLLTYRDVKIHARQIADVTRRHYMPPWQPEPGHGDFADERRLSEAQIQLIGEWAAAGAPEGPAAETPPPPKFTEGWQLGPPDMILEARQAFTLPASGSDVYWNFIFPVALDKARYVRAVEIRPGESRTVHHANLYVDRAHSARRLEANEGEGFPGMDVAIDRPVSEPDDGHFLFWKPGGAPYVEPDGFAWRLDPASDLVLNAHLQPTGKPEQVRPSIGLYFTDKPPQHFPMLVELEHDGALEIPAGNRDFVVSDDFRLPMDVDVLAVYPHAHYLGHVLEGYATLPNGQRTWLIRIPGWDPNWQSAYHYRKPVFLPKGTVVSMRYHYDNSAANPRNPNQPPKRVVGGNQATDEMGHLWLQVLPRSGSPLEKGDRRIELEEALARHRYEKYPGDFAALFEMGAIRLARLDPSQALVLLSAAVHIQPDHAEARNMLGSALAAVGRNTEAMEQFRAALKARPDYGTARYNLARALARAGKLDQAADLFNELATQFPGDGEVRDELAEIYARQRRFPEAIARLNESLAIDPNDERAIKDRDAILAQAPEAAAGAQRLQQAPNVRWIRPRRPLPSFALRSLDGNTLRTPDLRGKAVLIDVWAAWCAPCRAEHAELQKLYERVKDRPDLAILSFNVDDDARAVAPYMTENHYTFPVLLASDFADAYLSVVFLPQIWFLDAEGRLQWIHEGFESDPHWQETMLARLQELLKSPP